MNRLVEPHWRPITQFPSRSVPKIWRPWLTDKKSMTKRLKSLCGRFQVKLLKNDWGLPNSSERNLLNLPIQQKALIRETHLCGDDRLFMFARAIMPVQTLTGFEQQLAHLGTKPLGQFLFQHADCVRSDFLIAKLIDRNIYFQQAQSGCNFIEILYGRRSIFYLRGKSLLLTEIFASDFPLYD